MLLLSTSTNVTSAPEGVQSAFFFQSLFHAHAALQEAKCDKGASERVQSAAHSRERRAGAPDVGVERAATQEVTRGGDSRHLQPIRVSITSPSPSRLSNGRREAEAARDTPKGSCDLTGGHVSVSLLPPPAGPQNAQLRHQDRRVQKNGGRGREVE